MNETARKELQFRIKDLQLMLDREREAIQIQQDVLQRAVDSALRLELRIADLREAVGESAEANSYRGPIVEGCPL